jgi:hypothetical protein
VSTVPQKPAAVDRDPDLDADIDSLIDSLVPDFIPDAEVWKTTRNPKLGDYRPVDLIGTPMEIHLRNMLRAARQGAFS